MTNEDCPAVCLMADEHWGSMPHRCELGAGHVGEHRTTLNACEPPAALVWSEAGVVNNVDVAGASPTEEQP